MEKKKIATAVDILINVAKFEHIQITKYAEKEITYENKEEMIEKENALTGELVDDIIRTMRGIPEKLGKEVEQRISEPVAKVEESIKGRIPEWLENGAEPNIANTAKKNFDKAVANQNAEAIDSKIKADVANDEVADLLDDTIEIPTETKAEAKVEIKVDEDLFGNDEDLFK